VPLPERELIAKIRQACAHGRATAGIVRGIGDDCAVLRLPPGHEALVTTDFSLEDVHFRLAWHPPESVGHRCLTRGLSDIASMGGMPLAAFLSLALPSDLAQSWVDGFVRGFLQLARRFGVELAGGDTAQSPAGVLADIMVLGSAPRGKAVLRSGARPGDDLFVTGALGGAAAVLHRLRRQMEKTKTRSSANSKSIAPPLVKAELSSEEKAHFFPEPRLAAGPWLRERGLASAMIDLSDGFSTDLSHLCEESGVGAWIPESALPLASTATLDEALNGGDDYELLFTVPPAKHERIPGRIAGVPVRWVGVITETPGMWLVAPDNKSRTELNPRGWQHFEQKSNAPARRRSQE